MTVFNFNFLSLQNCDYADYTEVDHTALLLSYCRKVASGMVYLGLKSFVHRDLAARNILVSNEGDCKVRIYLFIIHVVKLKGSEITIIPATGYNSRKRKNAVQTPPDCFLGCA